VLQRVTLHPAKRDGEQDQPGRDQPATGLDQHRDVRGDADRDQHRADIPSGELGGDQLSRRRIGRQERAHEELSGAEHQLRDPAQQQEVQGEPVQPVGAGGRIGDAG
jgi:hypothetical protein